MANSVHSSDSILTDPFHCYVLVYEYKQQNNHTIYQRVFLVMDVMHSNICDVSVSGYSYTKPIRSQIFQQLRGGTIRTPCLGLTVSWDGWEHQRPEKLLKYFPDIA